MAARTARTDRSPRQRLDVDERREAILAAAVELFRGAPYAAVSTADIARASGSSPALVFHYFGSKAALYAAVVRHAVDALATAQRTADDALSPGVPVRDRVRTALLAYLDHVADHPAAWAAPLTGGGEPPEAQDVRRRARATYVDALREVLGLGRWARHDYALWGYVGFVDQACLRWVDSGCPPEDRNPLVEAALGALEGALGDWGG